MARIGDILYFAPGLPFSGVDVRKGGLPNQLYRRIDGFYLRPAIELARAEHVFASGLLAVCAADALGWFITGAEGSHARIVGLVRKIPSLDREEDAEMFCEQFRNGLVHETRVKGGSEFSLGIGKVAERYGPILMVNPLLLAEHVRRLLESHCEMLNRNTNELHSLKGRIQKQFARELNQ